MNTKSKSIESKVEERDLLDIAELEDIKGQDGEDEKRTPSSEFKKVRSATIDNYQGEECDIIILDLVRSNKNGIIGFLKEFQRMNVALSRAKIGMFIIGSRQTLEMKEGPDGNWTKFFKLLDENECIHPVFKT